MVIHCDTAQQMYETITSLKEQATDTNKILASCEFMNYKFRGGQSVSEYVAGLNIIVSKLKMLGKFVDDVELIAKILQDLPRDYENFRQNWRLMAAETPALVSRDKFIAHLLSVESTMAKDKRPGEALLSHCQHTQQQWNSELARRQDVLCMLQSGTYSKELKSKPAHTTTRAADDTCTGRRKVTQQQQQQASDKQLQAQSAWATSNAVARQEQRSQANETLHGCSLVES